MCVLAFKCGGFFSSVYAHACFTGKKYQQSLVPFIHPSPILNRKKKKKNAIIILKISFFINSSFFSFSFSQFWSLFTLKMKKKIQKKQVTWRMIQKKVNVTIRKSFSKEKVSERNSRFHRLYCYTVSYIFKSSNLSFAITKTLQTDWRMAWLGLNVSKKKVSYAIIR